MLLNWTMKRPSMTLERLGFIPEFFDENDPRPAKEQIDANYQHGGGWRAMKGYAMKADGALHYRDEEDEEDLQVLAEAKLHDETIRFYDYAITAIVQPDGTFEVTRLD